MTGKLKAKSRKKRVPAWAAKIAGLEDALQAAVAQRNQAMTEVARLGATLNIVEADRRAITEKVLQILELSENVIGPLSFTDAMAFGGLPRTKRKRQ